MSVLKLEDVTKEYSIDTTVGAHDFISQAYTRLAPDEAHGIFQSTKYHYDHLLPSFSLLHHPFVWNISPLDL